MGRWGEIQVQVEGWRYLRPRVGRCVGASRDGDVDAFVGGCKCCEGLEARGEGERESWGGGGLAIDTCAIDTCAIDTCAIDTCAIDTFAIDTCVSQRASLG